MKNPPIPRFDVVGVPFGIASSVRPISLIMLVTDHILQTPVETDVPRAFGALSGGAVLLEGNFDRYEGLWDCLLS